jgi:DNA primase
MIAPSSIERIKELAIVDVISHYVDLKRSGSNYSAKSPFSPAEKTPSFYVVPGKNIFKCFSTGKGGDAITFVMEHLGMPFVDAVKEIAGKVGERIEYEISEKATEEQNEREQLYGLNRAAAKRYAEMLQLDSIRDHTELTRRGFTNDTLLQWQIGYAPTGISDGYKPDEWKFLTSMLHEKALIEPAMKIGLVKEKDKIVYDVFRNRIMFPIHDHHGRIVGFGGRWLGADDKFNPKYLNTGETLLFDKSKVLYGLHFAGHNIRKMKIAYLMEGYTDVISFHQAGMDVAVATCGTALTDDQCVLLKKVLQQSGAVPGS